MEKRYFEKGFDDEMDDKTIMEDKLDKSLDYLDKRSLQMVKMRFGIDQKTDGGKTFREIANKFNLSKGWVRLIIIRSLRRIRRRLKDE